MICARCREAALKHAAGDTSEAVLAHAGCKGGTWCDCQHVPPPVTAPQPGGS